MTPTIKLILICYWTFTVLYESIFIVIEWKRFKKKMEKNEMIQVLKMTYQQSAQMQLFWKRIWSPLGFFVGFTFLCITSPVLFVFSVQTLLKKLFGYKSALEKRAEEEAKMMEEAQQKRDEFMRTEGVYSDDDTAEMQFIGDEQPVNPN
ncbi:MAG: hypothetical protein WC026_13325 [Hyphomicrobium sp.]|uniref:hypothetical protein n=1 Tax=Hyphomicrobium sp. TaxID=82 RepID=UPI0035687C08